ncbi:hypothetical protein INR49_019904 [Caranx melampygus]|nr:hypothetical protein INR49_019904 [Caranx melampygus]
MATCCVENLRARLCNVQGGGVTLQGLVHKPWEACKMRDGEKGQLRKEVTSRTTSRRHGSSSVFVAPLKSRLSQCRSVTRLPNVVGSDLELIYGFHFSPTPTGKMRHRVSGQPLFGILGEINLENSGTEPQ